MHPLLTSDGKDGSLPAAPSHVLEEQCPLIDGDSLTAFLEGRQSWKTGGIGLRHALSGSSWESALQDLKRVQKHDVQTCFSLSVIPNLFRGLSVFGFRNRVFKAPPRGRGIFNCRARIMEWV